MVSGMCVSTGGDPEMGPIAGRFQGDGSGGSARDASKVTTGAQREHGGFIEVVSGATTLAPSVGPDGSVLGFSALTVRLSVSGAKGPSFSPQADASLDGETGPRGCKRHGTTARIGDQIKEKDFSAATRMVA